MEIPKGEEAKASGSEKSRSNSNIRRNDVSSLLHRLFSSLDAHISFFIFSPLLQPYLRARANFFSPPFSPFSPLATLFYPFASSFSPFFFLLFFHRVSLLFAQRRFKLAPKPRRFYSRPLLRPLVP